MKFTIGDREFDLLGPEQITGDVAMGIKKNLGIGLGVMQRRLEEFDRLTLDENDHVVILTPAEIKAGQKPDPSAFFESEPHMKAFFGILWASRRCAGDPVSFEDSCKDINLVEMQKMFSGDEPVEPENPTKPRRASGVERKPRARPATSRSASTRSTRTKATSQPG